MPSRRWQSARTQLFAQLVLDRGGAVHAVLPYADIERSFGSSDLPLYRELVVRAQIEVLQTPGTDEDAYMAAGRRVVDLSDQLIAVWDAKPAQGKGGTADIVAYAGSRGIPTLRVNPVDRTVTRVV